MEDLPQQDIYGSNERPEVRPFVPTAARSAVDVGCGAGGFGRTLRALLGPDARVLGVEAVAVQAGRAREQGCFDEIVEGYFPACLDGLDEKFDLITFNDVLEHMVDPWEALRAARKHLNPEGQVLATIPSIQFAPVVWQLVRGRWDYASDGTLDRTHVRFFTRATMVEMFEGAGYTVETCVGVNSVRDVWATDPRWARRAMKLVLAAMLGDTQYVQFVVVARSLRT